MKKIEITAFDLAKRFTGVKEVKGIVDNPQIMTMLQLDDDWPQHDEVPWCSGFANYVLWLLRLPRSHSLAAISWETVGRRITIEEAIVGFDLVVIKRGTGTQRHVTFFGGIVGERFIGLGGNQDNQVKISTYAISDITAVIRVYGDEDADDNKVT